VLEVFINGYYKLHDIFVVARAVGCERVALAEEQVEALGYVVQADATMLCGVCRVAAVR
jgi:hypothetical protein